MRKLRGGLRVGRKLVVNVLKWVIRPRRKPNYCYRRLGPPTLNFNPVSKIFNWAKDIHYGAKRLRLPLPYSEPEYIRVGRDPIESKAEELPPKGYSAVYVGESDDDTHRVLVPVRYFNHPLFGELLQEAEKVRGFNHPGGITIPCGISDFEKVQTRIAAARRRILPATTWQFPEAP
ncbi:Auxin-responsive protein [Quillaja saponaria]|uniref:Auxin-responsive protein n=1 Tax=Quillaja saponaria TaxID=32244 RepID=A0AAD7KS75_QUISA|nr:Auxin-responsive protein [Quillaja saponaria]